MGGSDIFMAKKQGNGFLAAQNLGGKVNSAMDDFAFLLDVKTDQVYFASNRTGNDMLYSFSLHSLDTFSNDLVALDGSDEQPSISHTPPQVTEVNSSEFESADVTKMGDSLMSVSLTGPVYFISNSYELSDSSRSQLDVLIAELQQNDNIKVQINAFTDARASSEYNLALSDLRAFAVKSYLIKNGIAPQRLFHRGFGESNPVNRCVDGVDCDESEHALNRRVELKRKSE